MFGIWQPTRPLRSPTDSSPRGERLEHAQPLWVRQRATDGRVSLALRLGGHREWRELVQHPEDDIIACASTQVSSPVPDARLAASRITGPGGR